VNALQRFEGWVNQAVEGGLAGLLGGQLQPVDLAKRLADYMDDHRTVGAGRVYVPNVYRLYLAPTTLAGFTTFSQALEAELAAFLTGYAAERSRDTVGRMQVTLLADAGLRAQRVRVEGDLVDRRALAAGEGAQFTRPLPAAVPAPVAPRLALMNGRQHVPLVAQVPLCLGRALDNDVILDDTSVSRHHARLVPRVGYWLVEDLGSTHGTYVNNRRITSAPLRAGDRLRLGATELVVATIEAPAPP
jgi:hypothetical protein